MLQASLTLRREMKKKNPAASNQLRPRPNLIPATMDSGPVRCSTRLASLVHPTHAVGTGVVESAGEVD